ncbi:disease resistance protein RUN1-like [Eucalyptus grandis]|uniref:disease resistance protein RUN1-like n=1 Tax=Eucalyptus grandis TaxID=71139 RepID=UPI00192EF71B|nr:disease resistance protein RUN1-like [Eucalyptus grandis]
MDLPPHDFDDISRKITTTTGGLPLAIAVIGSSLQGKSKTSWKVTLQKLKSVPNREVFNKLKVSYDMLEAEQQEIFLDIACFFIGKDILHPSYMWKASNYFPEMELLVLTRKSLIKITKDLKFWMHDQLRDLGREIVRCEDINFPENCSRLWEPEFALEVVQRKKVSENLKVIEIYLHEKDSRLLEMLKFEEIDYSIMCKLARGLRMLRTMALIDSWIAKLPKTIGGLESLLELDLTRTRIRKLPASIGNLKKLRKMSMLQAPIKKLPKEIGGLESLLVLDLNYTKITKLPTSIGKLKQLEIVGVIGTMIRELPNAIWMLKNLKVLNAGYFVKIWREKFQVKFRVYLFLGGYSYQRARLGDCPQL